MKFVSYDQWGQLPENANSLFERASKDSVFISRSWLENLTNHALTENQTLLLACVLEDDHVLAILPMIKHAQGSLSSLSNNFTTLYSLLIADCAQQDVILSCLGDGLFQMPVEPIRFEPIDENDGNMIRLRKIMESCGFVSHPYFRFYNWSHPLNGHSFNEYMAARPASLRNTIRRKQRKLEREFNYEIRMYQDVDINQAFADYNAVYKASWKANELFSEFTPNLVKSLSRLGWLRLGILYVKHQPVAAQIWFVVHGKANIYRLVYDKDWKQFSPGSILTEHLMRHVIEVDHVTEIDFLTGNERYKQDWMTVRQVRSGLHFVKHKMPRGVFSQIVKTIKNFLTQKNKNGRGKL